MNAPQFDIVEDHRELPADEWVVVRFGSRFQRWRARCACGDSSGALSSAGMVAGWRAAHLDQVLARLSKP